MNFSSSSSLPPPLHPSSSSGRPSSTRNAGGRSIIRSEMEQQRHVEASPSSMMMVGNLHNGGRGGKVSLQPSMARFHWPLATTAPQGQGGGGMMQTNENGGGDEASMMDWGGTPSSTAYMVKTEAPRTPSIQGMDGSSNTYTIGRNGGGYVQPQQMQVQQPSSSQMIPPPPPPPPLAQPMEGMRSMPVLMISPQGSVMGIPPHGGGRPIQLQQAGEGPLLQHQHHPPQQQLQQRPQQAQQGGGFSMPAHLGPAQFMQIPSPGGNNGMPPLPPSQGGGNGHPNFVAAAAPLHSPYHHPQHHQQQPLPPTQPIIAPRPHVYQPPPILPRNDGPAPSQPNPSIYPDEEDCSSQLGQDEVMTEERKKRLRNEREQKRAHLITDQIDTLKHVLESSNFPLRSTSKYDVLAGCDEYIQHLRQRKNCLDMELKLGNPPSSQQDFTGQMSVDGTEQTAVVLDFCEIFRSSHVPMAVVSIDGRILQCNDEFTRVTGYTNDKLAGVTLFSLAAPECLEELFKSIARLLSTAALNEKNPAYFATAAARAAPLSLPGYEQSNILLSLVRDDERQARAFHCCIVPQRGPHSTASTSTGPAPPSI